MENKKKYTVSEVKVMFKAYMDLVSKENFSLPILIKGYDNEYTRELRNEMIESCKKYNEQVPSNIQEIIPINILNLERLLK